MLNKDTQRTMFANVNEHGGGTFAFDGTVAEPESGYAVALEGFELIIPTRGTSAANFGNLCNDLLRQVEDVADPETHYLGVWRHNGDLFVDLVSVVSDLDEATAKGRENNQLAIWDFANNDVIELV